MVSSRKPGVPSYLRHKASGQAITVIRSQGKRKQIYLGPYDSPESHRRYREVLAEYLDPACDPFQASAGSSDPVASISVEELVARFLAWAEPYYRKSDGSPSREFPNYVAAVRPLLKLYRDESAEEFGPLKLKRVRELMVERGWARRSINKQVGRLKRMFKWGVESELVAVDTFARLQAVSGLKRGRTEARETAPTEPVQWGAIEAVLEHVSSVVKAMILLQWHTGMRPSEAVGIRRAEIDRSGEVWVYRPADHKTAYRGRERVVFIGPRAQKILAPFLHHDGEFIFRPVDAEDERRRIQRQGRATPLWPSHLRAQQAKRARKPRRSPGQSYSVDSYRRAIHRACEEVGIAKWSPNRLRHSRATEIRRQFGLEAAQVTLGHASADITQVYAKRDNELALRVARETG